MNSKSLYAFYGSLRRGMMYYEVFKDGLEYQFSAQVEGFKLYALKSYPFAIKTNLSMDSIEVEVFKVINSDIEKKIHELELGVGYYYDEIKIKSIIAGIYLFYKPENYPEVKGGDWVKFFGSR
jgi:gamma-glutamylcyclotransferase (GGCT)/AIG2-like uncharacterized protein YtfP